MEKIKYSFETDPFEACPGVLVCYHLIHQPGVELRSFRAFSETKQRQVYFASKYAFPTLESLIEKIKDIKADFIEMKLEYGCVEASVANYIYEESLSCALRTSGCS